MGQKPNRGKIVSEAAFRRMWEDLTISQVEIGRQLGISPAGVRGRAASRGLPPRDPARPWRRKLDHARIIRLYQSGLSTVSIAKMLGCDAGTVRAALVRAEVPLRPRHRNAPGAVTAEAWVAKVLAASARETEAALCLAEMKDGYRNPHTYYLRKRAA